MRGAGDTNVLSPLRLAVFLWALCLCTAAVAAEPAPARQAFDTPARLVFGSFAEEQRAWKFAARVSRLVRVPVQVAAERDANQQELFRVVGPVLAGAEQSVLGDQATSAGLDWWRLPAPAAVPPLAAAPGSPASVRGAIAVGASTVVTAGPAVASSVATPGAAALALTISADESGERRERGRSSRNRREFDVDVGVQNRIFAYSGINTADQWQQSVAVNLNYSADFRNGLDSLRARVFGRWDSDDSQRSHSDLRELSWTHVFSGAADSWQLQAGVGQVFWGVVEFNHLIDVVNQTDLVENPDAEEKLGQPLISLTNIRDWGTLELFVLPGFRERRLPGLDGRLALALPVDRSATRYESGAEDKRIDGIVRLSTLLGGVAVDLYHFNGTRRTPRFEAGIQGAQQTLVPVYDTVKRTALAAQANAGDTAFKLEAYAQRGGPKNYWAGVLGLEHTFVGAFRSSADLGLVLEYHHDSRGAAAFDSVFERDLALGARWARNDLNDSQALLGVVWDTKSHERAVLLEASRRLNDRWSLELESRWFGGGEALGRFSTLSDLLDNDNKLGSLQRDDYIQLEFTRFF